MHHGFTSRAQRLDLAHHNRKLVEKPREVLQDALDRVHIAAPRLLKVICASSS